MSNEINIYVAALAVQGHGRWIDATMGAEDIRAEIADMLSEEGCSGTDYAITDFEAPGDIKIGEHDGIDHVVLVAELVEELGDAFVAAYGYECDLGNAESMARDCYYGCFESELDFTYHYIDDTGMLSEMPESLQGYFDYDALSRDLFISDFTSVDSDDGVHVFSSH